MKRKLLLSWGICFVLTASLFAQKPFKPTLKNAFDNVEVHELTRSEFTYSSERALCEDTIRYAEAKEAILGSSSFVGFGLWADDNEAITHTFLNSGSLTITGAEVLAVEATTSPVNPVMEVALYSVDGSYTPTTQLASGTVTVSAQNYYYVNFSSPVVVTDNYALVIRTTNAASILVVGINDDEVNSYDEGLSKYRSSYYSSSSGNWISVSAFTEYVSDVGYAVDFEPIVSPIVSYNISPTADIDPLTACVGEEVTFTNTTNTGILSNRMYNYSAFRHHFGTAPTDSTFVWFLDNGEPLVWSENTAYTYASAGVYNTEIGTNGGFWNSCFDYNTYTITINDLDDATFSYPSNTLCLGGGAVVPTITGVSGGTFSVDNADLVIDPTTGEIDLDASQEGIYTVTYTTNDNCPNDESVTIIVNDLDDATFSYPSNTLCLGGGAVVPTITGVSGGTFSVDNADLVIDPTTGEIDIDASQEGIYTVTYTTNDNCPNDESVTIIVNDLDDATFSYPSNTLCFGGGAVVPTITGVSGGTFSVDNTDLVIDPTTGEIDLDASQEGIYTVTYTTNDNCPNDESVTITVTSSPDASFTYDNTDYCSNEGTILPSFVTGASAGQFTSTAGLMFVNASTGEINLNASDAGTYTITNTIAASGSCPEISETFEITVNEAPTVTVSADQTEVCAGEEVTLTATASAGTVSWDNGATDGTPFIPAATTTYTVTVDNNGCEATDEITITVNEVPTVTASADQTEVCAGEEVTLTATASAGTVSWDNGVTDGAPFTPTATTTYTVTADNNGCTETDEITITVNELPTVTASADQTEVCAGEEVTLTATASAGTISWDNDVNNGTPFTPTATTTYTVTANDNGCEETQQITITVNEIPTITVTADETEVCTGEEVTLTATASAGSVTWDNGVNNGTPFTPTATTTYTVTANDNGCEATEQITITVNELPTVTIDNGDIETCVYHDAIELTATPAGGTFSGPGVTNNSFDPQTAGNGTHTITYTYEDAEGCENSATIEIEVDGCVGISTNDLNSQVVLSPNPSTDYVDVAVVGNNQVVSIQVISLEGKIMNTRTKAVDAQTTRIDVSSLSTGTYLVQLSTDNGTVTKKMVVQ